MFDSLANEIENETPDPLNDTVKKLFGLSYLFPYQRLVITNIMEALDADDLSDRKSLGRQIVILPTGAGKSLCFQLPAMMIEGVTLVIYPILSLMADQMRRLSERGFSPVIIRGGQSKKERDEIWDKLEKGQSRFIIANPEVLLTPQVKTKLERINIIHIVIDEAHCVSEWGESFRPSYLEIGSIIKPFNSPLITAFTATASSPVLEKIQKYIFTDIQAGEIIGSPDRPNINYSAKGCINRNMAVRDLLIENSRPAIVFCSSRPGTEKLAHYLRNETAGAGYPWCNEIKFYHAGLSREEKAGVEKWYFNNSEAVLCATCAYGMGVDKADIRTVIHRDCPPSIEAYLQESGRAGRDGEQSKAIFLWGPEDETALARAKTEKDRLRITALLRYARDINTCRRHSLLALLNYDSGGEVPEKLCCDVCENTAKDALREEASILDFFHRNKRKFSKEEASIILAQDKTINWSEQDAQQIINYLMKTKKLRRIRHFPWKNKISP